jgi:Ca2+-binding EF-hand superfamily protein
VKTVFLAFDVNKNGVLDYNEFLNAFRVSFSNEFQSVPNQYRTSLIEFAYQKIQHVAGGKVTLDALGR